MRLHIKKQVFIFFILISLVLSTYSVFGNFISVPALEDNSPLWFTSGNYVEFSSTEKNMRVEFIDGKDYFGDRVSLKWICLDLNETLAKIELTLKLYSGSIVNEKFSVTVLVDISNRDVFSIDGSTYYGKTTLWLPTNVRDGEQVTFNYSNITMVSIIRKEGGNVKTPYGYQKVFVVKLRTENAVLIPYKGEKYNRTLSNFLEYDEDTGVLIGSSTFMGEGILYALGVLITPPLTVSDTNIDLGPELMAPLIVNTLFGIAPVVIFLVLFVVIYLHKRRQKHLRKRYIKAKQKRKT